jgi:LysM repeat protein
VFPKKAIVQFCFYLSVGLTVACASSAEKTPASPTNTAVIRPYVDDTATVQAPPSGAPEFLPTIAPVPTSTPFLYTVVANDTLIGIAVRFNVSLDELLAVNPGVDPRFLSIGTELVIPSSDGESVVSSLPTPTPVPVAVSDPTCYMTADGGMWCIILIENDQLRPLENFIAVLELVDEEGEQAASQIALTPLNVLQPGERMPLFTVFQPPIPGWQQMNARLLTSLEVSEDDERYLAAEITGFQMHISDNGLQGQVYGQVQLQDEDQSASLVWVAVIAYGGDGNVVGFRRWEGLDLEGGATLDFDLQVYSMGPKIEQIEVLVEARP